MLAQNEEGYRNLVKITSEASLHGFYYKPRVSKNFLAEHSRGLIGLSGCLKGEVAERLTEGKYDAAIAAAGTYRDIFGKENFYLEIQDQGLAMEHKIHPGLFKLEKDLGLPLVATNDSHYLCEDDAHAQDVMLCIQTGKSIHDTARMKFDGTQFFVKNHDEMYPHRSRSSTFHPATPSTVISFTSPAKVSRAAWPRCDRCTNRASSSTRSRTTSSASNANSRSSSR